MTSFTNLCANDGVSATWFWTHEVSLGPYAEYEVWDVVFVRNTNEPRRWVTDGETRRTVYFQGIPGSQDGSRRATGGRRREPDAIEALADLLSAANDTDNPRLRRVGPRGPRTVDPVRPGRVRADHGAVQATPGLRHRLEDVARRGLRRVRQGRRRVPCRRRRLSNVPRETSREESMKRITDRTELIELMGELGVAGDWHEPDQADVTVTVKGRKFDTAGFWPDCSEPRILERHVILKKNGKPVAAVNLAMLFAWATGYGADVPRETSTPDNGDTP